MEFEPHEIRTESFRKTNQLNINPTNVRVIHIASGLFAESTSERSYCANKAKAMALLKEKYNGYSSSSSTSNN